jgi:hypothetical protein
MNFPGHFDQLGRLKLRNREQWDAYGRSMAGKDVVLTVETLAQRRSRASNDYWWTVVVEFFRDQWSLERGRKYTKDDAHEVLVQHIVRLRMRVSCGPSSNPRTRDLTQADFPRLIEEAKHMAWQDYRSRIPEPNEERDGL